MFLFGQLQRKSTRWCCCSRRKILNNYYTVSVYHACRNVCVCVCVCTCSAAPCAHVSYVAPLITDGVVLLHCAETLTRRSIVASHCIQLTCRHTWSSAQVTFEYWLMMSHKHKLLSYHRPPRHPHCCAACSWRLHTSTRWFYSCRLPPSTNLKQRETEGKTETNKLDN